MRIVLDTNVLVAGLLSSGPPAWVVEAALSGTVDVALSTAVRTEYEDVLLRPEFSFDPMRVRDLLAALDRFALWIPAPLPVPLPLPDRDDEPFLALAAASGSVLVTGNLRHFPAKLRHGVVVDTPRGLIERLRSAG